MSPAAFGAFIVAVLGSPDDWQGVELRWPQFDLATKTVLERMLEPPEPGSARERSTWRKAADQALWSLDPTAELVPDGALAVLKGPDDRHGHYNGESLPLVCDGKPLPGLKIFRIAGQVEQLESEDSAAVKQARDKKRKDALDAAWEARAANHPFGPAELRCAMDWLLKQLPPPKDGQRTGQIDLAWANAFTGWVRALDKNGDIIARKFWEKVSESEHTAEVADPGITCGPCPKEAAAWCVSDVRVDGPAWQADVRVGDQLLAIDGEPPPAGDKDALWKKLSGAPKSKVALKLLQAKDGKSRDLKLVRDQAVDYDVLARPLQAGILHLRLRDFVKGTAGRLRATIDAALRGPKGKKPLPLKGILLDMRGHPGGILDEAIAVADALLAKGVIVRTQWRTRTVDREATETTDDIAAPLVVLVDKRCASACEVLTGALQDHRRGVVLGGKTFGKASMQEIKRPSLMVEFYIKTTIGRYLTPDKRNLDHVGTEPDVALPADPTASFAAIPPAWRPLGECVAKNGRAQQRLAADTAPRQKPDPWLEMARDFLDCAIGQNPPK